MIATEIETIGNNSSPNTASGSRNPVAGPATSPAISKTRIAGMCTRQAIHTATIPSVMMLASAMRSCSVKVRSASRAVRS